MRARTVAVAFLILTTACEWDVIGDLSGLGWSTGCDFSLAGRVTTPQGQGKKGVNVKLFRDGDFIGNRVKTNGNGWYTTGFLHVGDVEPDTVRFRKDGKTLFRSIPAGTCAPRVDLVWPWG